MRLHITSYLLILTMCLPFENSAQFSNGKSVFTSLYASKDYSFIDINGDGLLDIQSIDGGAFNLFMNQGDFRYASTGSFTFDFDKDNALFLDFGFIDYDGDGDQDLLVTSDRVRLYENTDGYTFKETSFSYQSFGLNQVSYIVEDFDQDGYEEFIMVNNFLGDITFYQFENQEGNLFFTEEVEMTGLGNIYIDQWDATGDGIDDFLLRSASTSSKIFDYASDGLSAPIDQPTIPTGRLALKDITGDGVDDILYQTGQNLYISESSEGALYATPYIYFAGGGCENRYAVIDYDLDGDYDILHGKCTSDGTFWRENNGGNYESAVLINTVGYQILTIQASDSNNDGVDEIFTIDNRRFIGCIELGNEMESNFTHAIASTVSDDHVTLQDVDNDSVADILIHDDNWAGIIKNENDYKGVQTVYNSGIRITNIKASDVDMDGDADLLILLDTPPSPNQDPTVILLSNLGDGIYADPQTLLYNYRDGEFLLLDDFDQDGDDDMMITSTFSGVEYFTNDGTGSFSEASFNGTTGSKAESIDLNNNGFKDVVIQGQTRISYYLNDTQGGFGSRVTLPGDLDFPRYTLADLDNDGDQDFIVSDLFSKFVVYRNDDLTFTEVYSQNLFVYGISAADFNGDGQVDILTGDGLDYFRNLGDFSFVRVEVDIDNTFGPFTFAENGQSETLDMLTAGGDDYGRIYIFRDVGNADSGPIDADGDGFTSDEDCDDTNASINPDAIEIANNEVDENCDGILLVIDEDEDGFNSSVDCDDLDPEINPAATEIPGNTIDENCDGIIEGEFGEPTFGSKRQLYGGSDPANHVHSADLNGDGLNDVLVCTRNQIILYTNQGNGTFSSNVLYEEPLAEFYATATADMDGDGRMDIVSSSEGGGTIFLFRNQDNDQFNREILADVNNSKSLNLADYDGDGNIDVLATYSSSTNGFSDRIGIYSLEANGTYSLEITLASGLKRCESLKSFDIDNDGDLDVFSVSLIDKEAFWFENEGNLDFSTKRIIAENLAGAQGIDVADLNLDGSYEVVVCNRNSALNSIQYMTALGNSQFAEPVTIPVSLVNKQINTVHIADLNYDGLPEICFSEDNNGAAGYVLNRGNFSFTTVILDPNASGASSVTTSDLDDDGVIDFLYSTAEGRKANYFINELTLVSTENVDLITDLSIYPNPFVDRFTVKLRSPIQGTVHLYDNRGALILSQSLMGSETEIILDDRSNQLYYLQLVNAQNEVLASRKVGGLKIY